MLEKRPAYLLKHMLAHPPLTVQQLSEVMSLSKKQTEDDLIKINEWLKVNKLPVIYVESKKTQPVQLTEEIRHFLRQKETKHEKPVYIAEDMQIFITYLYLFIRQEAVSTHQLNVLLKVTRNTSMAVIKKVNQYTAHQHVEVSYTRKNGYYLQGAEMNKRIIAQQCVSELLQKKNGLTAVRMVLSHSNCSTNPQHDRFAAPSEIFQEKRIAQKILAIQQSYHLIFVEERLYDFQHFLPFYFCRLKQKKFISYHSIDKQPMLENKLYAPAKELLAQEQLPVPEDEVAYMVTHLLGLSLGDTAAKEATLFNKCEQMLTDFENRTCTSFQNREQILHNLYQHFKPAFYRTIHRIPIKNPLLTEIKQEYAELLNIVKEVLIRIENQLQMTFPEDEIGYLTIHFGALLENPLEERAVVQAIIVCPDGVEACAMLQTQLTSLFPTIYFKATISLQAFNAGDMPACDLIFSTLELKTEKKLFLVKPVMTSLETLLLKQEVQTVVPGTLSNNLPTHQPIEEVKKHTVTEDEQALQTPLQTLLSTTDSNIDRGTPQLLKELLTETMIQFEPAVTDWQTAIHLAADPLVKAKKIEAGYPKAIIDNVVEFGPYIVIGPGIAMPHARPEDGVLEVGMSMLILKESVVVADNTANPVNVFICIAAPDHTTHLKALAQLTRLLTKKENQQSLIKAKTKAEILALIRAAAQDN